MFLLSFFPFIDRELREVLMRYSVASFLVLVFSSVALCGCETKSEPKLPASGSVQEFLDENPDFVEEELDMEEEEEFAAAEAEE
jgi:hypothetical protein